MANFKSVKELELYIRESILSNILNWPKSGLSIPLPLYARFLPEVRETRRNYQAELAGEHGSWCIEYDGAEIGFYTPYLKKLNLNEFPQGERHLVCKVLERVFYHYIPGIEISHQLDTQKDEIW